MNMSPTESNDLALAGSRDLQLPTVAPAEPDDCWNKIGIAGDRTCPELAAFVFCPNCPVYSKAGALFLDRAPSPEYRQEQSRRFALPRQPAAAVKTAAFVFRVQSDWLALP